MQFLSAPPRATAKQQHLARSRAGLQLSRLMISPMQLARLVALLAITACARGALTSAELRARAEVVARDTASHAWRHDVGVDSVRMRNDTAVVWVSPRKWMATDAPQAGVRVGPDGRIVAIQWIMGG